MKSQSIHGRIVGVCIFAIAAFLVLCPRVSNAQVPPRFYWKTLAGTNAVPALFQSLNGNANPLDPANVVVPDAAFEANVLIAGYAKILPLQGRSAMVALLLPMGRASSDVVAGPATARDHASGFGDPLLEVNVNLIGPPVMKTIPDMLRYEPGFSLDIIVDVAFPIGEYDSEQAVNLGQNRWYGRVGAPIVWQIGAWVPGRRTTIEVLPSLWWFTDNKDFDGKTLSTDPMYQVEGHLTRDLNEHLWSSLDGVYIGGGKSTIDGTGGESMSQVGVGFTLGYPISEGLQLTTAYMATVNDSDPGDLRMDGFRLSLVYGWHKVIDGMDRLQEK